MFNDKEIEERRKETPSITYYKNDDGTWEKIERSLQCPEDVFLADRCQGVKGHKGVHWAFSPCGSFCYTDNDDDLTCNGEAGSIPPENDAYRTPLSMQAHYHLSFFSVTPVTDIDLINRLNKGEEIEGADIDTPQTDEELKHFLGSDEND
jgi:hypothetical protein